jgi:hypothetical protein
LTVSPVASRSVVPVTTSPVFHPDAAVEAELRQRVEHLGPGPAGSQRVVLVCGGDPEDGHHRVPDELLHRAAVRLDDRLHALEVPREQSPQGLRISLLAECRRADEIAEQDCDRLANLAWSRRRRERCAAAVAEARALRVRLPAARAVRHGSMLSHSYERVTATAAA